ncbi:MAG: hypothetical protein H0V44_07435 [Planctomycetes bacterium]|nr:hypothetical protein [Planctomycetota bacterium]
MSANLLLDKIDQVRRRHRSVQISAGVFKSVLALIGLVAAFFILDWLVLYRTVGETSADRWARLLLLLSVIATFSYVVWRTVWIEYRRVEDDDDVALRIEKGHPELRGRLISTVQLTREMRRQPKNSGSKELIDALEEETVDFSRALNFSDIINLKVLKKVALVALGLTVFALGLGIWRSDFTKALLGRMALTQQTYPTATRIVVLTPGMKVAHGEPVTIELAIDAAGKVPEAATLDVRSAVAGVTSSFPMSRVAGELPVQGETEMVTAIRYRATIAHALEDCDFRAVVGDARTRDWQRLTVLQRPTIKALSASYQFPAYLAKAPETSAIGDLRALVGTKVRIQATLNKAVVTARLQKRFGDVLPEPIVMDLSPDGTVATTEIQIEKTGYYKILLHDVDDFDGLNPIDYAMEAIKDRAPQVKIAFPAKDKTVTRFARWPIAFEIKDDYGISLASLRYRVSALPSADGAEIESGGDGSDESEPGKELPSQGFKLDNLLTQTNQKEAAGEVVFDLRQLNISEGQKVTYWIQADDCCTPQANVGRSQRYTFTVVDAATMQEMLERERKGVLGNIKTIRDKQKETRDGVDKVRQTLRQGAPAPAPPAR